MSETQVTIGKPDDKVPERFEDAYRELLAISAKLRPAQGRIPDIDQIELLVMRAKRLAAYCQEHIESVRRLVDEQQASA
ncbi:hypothetical protein JMJ56_18970 [Belnapia sp. T18]|uniref:Uncharacterized protein n=1 Tax=Belnapia arida TaxID=2804533 RepID=A0ABS1U5Y9_9PROT|nr:hypothetical protein [Belnapia arida]MBL6080106.1 hypothetical protein [Belnapia arida]